MESRDVEVGIHEHSGLSAVAVVDGVPNTRRQRFTFDLDPLVDVPEHVRGGWRREKAQRLAKKTTLRRISVRRWLVLASDSADGTPPNRGRFTSPLDILRMLSMMFRSPDT